MFSEDEKQALSDLLYHLEEFEFKRIKSAEVVPTFQIFAHRVSINLKQFRYERAAHI